MPAWNAPRTPPPPPGAVDPLPDIATPGWAAWGERHAKEAAERDLPRGTPRRYGTSLKVSLGPVECWPISGDEPGPWKPTRTARTKPDEPHRDWTRFSRLYPRLVWQEVQAVHATLLIDYFGVEPPTRYFATFYRVLRGPIVEVGRVVHCWKRTSWEETSDEGTPLVFDDVPAMPDEGPIPSVHDLDVGDGDLPYTDDSYFFPPGSWRKSRFKDGWPLGGGVEFGHPRLSDLDELYRRRFLRDRELREVVERHAREHAATGRETDEAGDAAEAERARRRRRKPR